MNYVSVLLALATKYLYKMGPIYMDCEYSGIYALESVMKSESCSVVSDSLRPHGLYSPWNSLGQNTGVDSLSLLQGIFPPKDWTQVSHIAGRFFTSWATREAPIYALFDYKYPYVKFS